MFFCYESGLFLKKNVLIMMNIVFFELIDQLRGIELKRDKQC